jgi:hypothetical protein
MLCLIYAIKEWQYHSCSGRRRNNLLTHKNSFKKMYSFVAFKKKMGVYQHLSFYVVKVE